MRTLECRMRRAHVEETGKSRPSSFRRLRALNDHRMACHVLTKPRRVLFELQLPAEKAAVKRETQTSLTAHGAGNHVACGGVGLQLVDEGTNIHARSGNNSNRPAQVKTVPVRSQSFPVYASDVADTFNTALRWHMDRHRTGVAELARATGVSEGAIKQMRARPDSTTGAENAVAIARFYGKDVKAFLECEDVDVAEGALAKLLELLTPEEREIIEAQVRGLLASPAHRLKP